MMHHRYGLLLLGFGCTTLAALAVMVAADPAPTSAAPLAEPPTAVARDLQVMGVASCASTACHHKNGPKGSKDSEYTTWITHDKHARAYQVLFEDRSKRIEKNLKNLADVRQAQPEKNELCLKCHTTYVPAAQRGERYAVEDGIGCESCHGPAQKWLPLHYQGDWKNKTAAAKAAQGFWPTKDLTFRADLCVNCHVGTPDADMNHDLIAAGHPRLTFELGNYLANVPRHWNPEDDRKRQPDFEIRAWALGQVLCAKAAMELLEGRARAATKESPDRPWPEFAEYSCFACHHDLREPSIRQKRGYGNRLPGSLPLDNWYTTVLPLALSSGVFDEGCNAPAMDELQQAMSRPYPDPEQVARLARSHADQMAGCLKKFKRSATMDAATAHKLFAAIARDEVPVTDLSWEQATQRYLALVAVYQGMNDLLPAAKDPRFREPLEALRRPLEIPRGFESPTNFDPVVFSKEQKALLDRIGN